MEMKINGKDVKLKFGVKFCRIMDEKHKIDYEGMQFGMGVVNALLGLEQKNVSVLSDIIDAATKSEYHQDDVDDAIEDYAEREGGLKKLFEQVKSEMGKSPVVQETEKAFKNAPNDTKTNQKKPTKA
ncbi:tail assembly chaperone [Virgibacillus halophilus]|uniref:Tail assembly chaperone n=1 Tax=Tigheibacillus halophilus TaxID=361280 RepID=A0ABU5C7Z6_9BACI|nr:tail assembly chaperone [Virgibacillus halophilus]